MQHFGYTIVGEPMSARNPRVHTVLEPPLYRVVSSLAKSRGLSLSQAVRDLVAEAVELIEDRGLEAFAEERRRTFDPRRALTTDQVRRLLRRNGGAR